jgi:L-alanine-DL-glutamate epimerase-like enolase superfamily enzyme
MTQITDVRPAAVTLYFLPVEARVPLKFGHEVCTHIVCARVRMTVIGRNEKRADGWGETPISVQWAWPGELPYREKEESLLSLIRALAEAWAQFGATGHPLEIGHAFIQTELPRLLREANAKCSPEYSIPWLAALVCGSAFDIALHDAYGVLHDVPVYETYNADFMNHDLAAWLEPAAGSAVSFAGKYPADYLATQPARELWAWHLVGGLDAVDESELTGSEPDDDYPVLLSEWIARDGLKCLKIKLRGNDAIWDYERLLKIGGLAVRAGVLWLSADFNCTVHDPAYVNAILDRLRDEQPRLYGMLLYVEQPFPYELEQRQIDVHSVAARKPLFMDESAHDWQHIALGRGLGWNGVALKSCKTQSGALLSLCWARAHGMAIMVQDLSNAMLAQIPHVQLAARGHDHGHRVERNAVLSRSLAPRSGRASRTVSPPAGPARSEYSARQRFRLSPR